MKRLLTLTIMLIMVTGFTFPDEAKEKSQKAVLAYPQVSAAKSKIEKKGYQVLKETTGLPRGAVTYGVVAYYASQGEVSTKQFKNLRYREGNFEARPEVIYNYKKKDSKTLMTLNWRF